MLVSLIDPHRFPRTDQYLRQLPDGLDSYPEAARKGEFLHVLLGELATVVEPTDLPAPLGDYMTDPPKVFIPEVHSNTLYTIARDVFYDSDEALLATQFKVSSAVFRNPLYRAIMLVMSPSLLCMGATRRWGTFRRGTKLTVYSLREEKDRIVAEGRLEYPPRLFDHMLALTALTSLRAALHAARTRDLETGLLEVGENEARSRFSWSQ